jgi:hypothetical protein
VQQDPRALGEGCSSKNLADVRRVLTRQANHNVVTTNNAAAGTYLRQMQQYIKATKDIATTAVITEQSLRAIHDTEQTSIKVKSYVFHVQGVNLILNKWQGKTRQEKSASLREFKKNVEGNKCKLSGALQSWLQETAQKAQ